MLSRFDTKSSSYPRLSEPFEKLPNPFSSRKRLMHNSPSPPLRGRCPLPTQGQAPAEGGSLPVGPIWTSPAAPPLSLCDISPRKGGERGIGGYASVSARGGRWGVFDGLRLSETFEKLPFSPHAGEMPPAYEGAGSGRGRFRCSGFLSAHCQPPPSVTP